MTIGMSHPPVPQLPSSTAPEKHWAVALFISEQNMCPQALFSFSCWQTGLTNLEDSLFTLLLVWRHSEHLFFHFSFSDFLSWGPDVMVAATLLHAHGVYSKSNTQTQRTPRAQSHYYFQRHHWSWLCATFWGFDIISFNLLNSRVLFFILIFTWGKLKLREAS